ncbi:MAG: hypothetical protein ACXAB9_15190, partial [Candidatus Thorarchaeota archaeon]
GQFYSNLIYDNDIGIRVGDNTGESYNSGNVFYHNTIDSNDLDGVHIRVDTPTTVWKNNSITNNTQEGIDDDSTNDPTVNDNLLNGNAGGNSSGFTLDITGDDANLTSAPAYVSASDRHLTVTSPGKDTGATGLGVTLDFDQVPTGQGGFDMGAYEFDTQTQRGMKISRLR